MITTDIFESHLSCKYKTYLRLQGKTSLTSEFNLIHKQWTDQYKNRVLQILRDRYHLDSGHSLKSCQNDLGNGAPALFKCRLKSAKIECQCDVLEKVQGKSDTYPFLYIPIRIIPSEKLIRTDQLVLGLCGLVLGEIQGVFPSSGKIIHGYSLKTQRVKFDKWIASARDIIEEIGKIKLDTDSPGPALTNHCKTCEFMNHCRSHAETKDDLSLLRGLSGKDISKLNKRGIFTVTQYSYTFRARRARSNKIHRRLLELQALAIRDKKIYILKNPELPTTKTRIYFDVEGDPDQDFYYLVSLVVDNEGEERYSYFWIERRDEETHLFNQFLSSLQEYHDYVLFHYGEYETRFLKRAASQKDEPFSKLAEQVLEKSKNVLGAIYSDVYFPTFSNELKEIAGYLGFKWSEKEPSGLHSIAWRHQWEMDRRADLRERLIRYNREDCLALKLIVNFLYLLQEGKGQRNDESQPEFSYARDLKDQLIYKKFGKIDFFFPDMEYINRCAYFDYQRDKISLRQPGTRPKRFINYKQKPSSRNWAFRINKVIKLSKPGECPTCGSLFDRRRGYAKPYVNQNCFRKVTDLQFRGTGINRRVTKYLSGRYKCSYCRSIFTVEDFKKLEKYGHGLVCFIVYFNVALILPINRIQDSLQDLFGMQLPRGTIQELKKRAASYYEDTYQELVTGIRKSHFVAVDETQVQIGKEKKYIWVFTNMKDVVFAYSGTREGSFLRDFLVSFSGVLVSDFYAVYDSINCSQQKCLVHLIRDMNDDLVRDPFNEEFKDLVKRFSILLRNIIETVDKKGLNNVFLKKHSGDVDAFFRETLKTKFESEMARK
jgi:predicted RecB family nuclease